MTSSVRRKLPWLVPGLVGLSGLSMLMLAARAGGQVTADEMLKLLQGVNPTAKVEASPGGTVLYGLAVAVMTALSAAVGVLWRLNLKQSRQLRDASDQAQTRLREADAATLHEAKSASETALLLSSKAAEVREKILERVNAIDQANAEWRAKGIAAIGEMAREIKEMASEIRGLKEHCSAAGGCGLGAPFAGPAKDGGK